MVIDNRNPRKLMRSYKANSENRFMSTYGLDLLSRNNMYRVLDFTKQSLDKEHGILLLSLITRGYSIVNGRDYKDIITKSIEKLKIHFLGI